MRTSHRKFFLLALLVLLTGTLALFGKNRNGDQNDSESRRRRRRLTETAGGGVGVDVDAATGTVTHIVTPEDAAAQRAAEAAKTCDGQMAQSLVKANNAMLEAQAERDEAVTSNEKALAKVEELETTVLGLNAKIEQMNVSHAAVIQALEAKLVTIEQEQDEEIEQMEKDQNEKIEEMTTSHSAAITALEAKIAAMKEERANELARLGDDQQATIAKVIAEKDAAVAALEERMEESKKASQESYDAKMKDAETAHAEQLAALQSKLDTTIEEMKAERAVAVADLTAQLEAKAKEAEDSLASTKESAKKYMIAQVTAVKEEMATMEKDYEEKLESVKKSHTQLDRLLKTTFEKKMDAERALEEAEEEVQHWRGVFAGRGYCNLTYVASDVYTVSEYAYNQSADYAYYAADVLDKNGRYYYNRAAETTAVVADETYKVARQQYEQHWPTVAPHYEKHVNPLVKKFVEWRQKKVDPITRSWRFAYQNRLKKLGSVYEKHCKATYKEAYKYSQENNLPFDEYLAKPWASSCKDGKGSIETLMTGLRIILVLIFRRFVFGTIWTILLWVTPLGLIFRRRKQKKAASEPSDADAAPAINGNGARTTAATNGKYTNGVAVASRTKKKKTTGSVSQ